MRDYRDASCTIQELKETIQEFCIERNWDQFQTPKELAITLSIESGELLELFRFLSDSQVKEKMCDPTFNDRIRQELSDVFYCILRFAQTNDIDLSSSLEEKIELNRIKYPVEKAFNSNKKYNEMD